LNSACPSARRPSASPGSRISTPQTLPGRHHARQQGAAPCSRRRRRPPGQSKQPGRPATETWCQPPAPSASAR